VKRRKAAIPIIRAAICYLVPGMEGTEPFRRKSPIDHTQHDDQGEDKEKVVDEQERNPRRKG
jgi:hypothetical protein